MELTPAIRAKRVAIARDMLKQLERSDVPLRIVHGGGYVGGYLETLPGPEEQIQPFVDLIQQHCDMCELGGLLLSKARLYDAVPMSVIVSDSGFDELNVYASHDDVASALADIFDPLTLDMLEAAFEGSDMFTDLDKGDEGWDQVIAAAEFGQQLPNSIECARTIAQLLIDGDGEFLIPTPAPEVAR